MNSISLVDDKISVTKLRKRVKAVRFLTFIDNIAAQRQEKDSEYNWSDVTRGPVPQ